MTAFVSPSSFSLAQSILFLLVVIVGGVETVAGPLLGSVVVVLLPELLDDEDDWRVNPSLNLSSHRPIAGGVIVWLKRALLLPLTRWLFDYSRENFARQERLNFVLMACVQQLAIENARLVARLDALDGGQQGQATPGNGSNPA